MTSRESETDSIQSKSEREVKVAQSRPTLCDPMNCTVHGILYYIILE